MKMRKVKNITIIKMRMVKMNKLKLCLNKSNSKLMMKMMKALGKKSEFNLIF
jgi:hypothetical protein